MAGYCGVALQAGRALGAGEEVECRSGPEVAKLIFNIFGIFSASSLWTLLFQGLRGGGLDFNLFRSRLHLFSSRLRRLRGLDRLQVTSYIVLKDHCGL